MSGDLDAFLGSRTRLRPLDAVAALLRLADGRYVMQLRDSNRDIFYPDHWGCFGGAVDPGETPGQAIVRELREELDLRIGEREFTRFTEFTFDFSFCGFDRKWRVYYEIILPNSDMTEFVLSEGAGVEAFEAESLLAQHRVVPYDAFAIWMHHHRGRFSDAPTPGR